MPQRNLLIILISIGVAYACYLRAEQNPYARCVASGYTAINDWALDNVPDDELFGGAIQGMIDVLRRRGDEHSQFIPRQDAEPFLDEMRQQFGGIGVRIRLVGDPPRLTVIGPPQPGTPAFHADIRSGDRILAIDGQPTAGFGMDEVIRRMRGSPGEPIQLTVQHPGQQQAVTIELVRQIITVESVLGDVRQADGSWQFRLADDPRIAYVRVVKFGDKTVQELSEVLDRLTAENVEAVVLDLRDNAGGTLDAAVAVADMFLPAGLPIVETRGRDQEVRSRQISTGRGGYQNIPLAVLINQYSASASEIVAACLQDYHRATVIGQRSFGKGTVQIVREMGPRGSSVLKLTSASFWRPSGTNIHRMPGDAQDATWGVLPDPGFDVPLTQEEYVAYRKYRSDRDLREPLPSAEHDDSEKHADDAEFVDRAKQRAVDHLQEVLSNSPASPGLQVELQIFL